MKKLTLSIGLVAAMLSAKSQDTTEVMVTSSKVYYYKDKEIRPYKEYLHNNNIFFNVSENEVLCVHLYDKKSSTRKFITTYNNSKTINILNSKSNIYCNCGPFKLQIK